ncbi:hypothetical protein A2316_02605 [Candidatus Falkowbacteria bacterium RIFOXYB2_FULL_38_15]|uniref:Transmembrane protein (PGPGW) n=1 Tax=Candidatus Falkowbacteria bacterium RIFOXYA2_FULL_38_12 TaxID=1797993 RepID=A0A1F5S1Z3_9BACT|nr:MAG: hypothetical protein A2257_03065 [Candidatus Falkowbacteria bacterium RIFOXYA2_FULL_38_12]OGF32541.1 MAG: hypothetical protein A2316_02605 [Candidatus Falkowbacteria bacterium RIFOXYB2_FULL_38_15]OGF41993.1 MAG: hypothetical protein A2555_04025 [Candidatus Falkowbacteria bacterium RIFOXYD2_FULL_39_16]
MAFFKKIFQNNPKIKKIIGAIFLLIGLIALITPFTPGSWLIFVGLELLGIRFLLWDKIKNKFKKQ